MTQIANAMNAAKGIDANTSVGIAKAVATATPEAIGGNLSGLTFDQLSQTHAEAIKQGLKVAAEAVAAEVVRRYNGRVKAGKPIFPTMQTFMTAYAPSMLSPEAKLWKKPEAKAKAKKAAAKPVFDVEAILKSMGINAAELTKEQKDAAYAFLSTLAKPTTKKKAS